MYCFVVATVNACVCFVAIVVAILLMFDAIHNIVLVAVSCYLIYP